MSKAQAPATDQIPGVEDKASIRSDILSAATETADNRQFTKDDLRAIYHEIATEESDTAIGGFTKRKLMVEIGRVTGLDTASRLEGSPQPYFTKNDLVEIREALTR